MRIPCAPENPPQPPVPCRAEARERCRGADEGRRARGAAPRVLAARAGAHPRRFGRHGLASLRRPLRACPPSAPRSGSSPCCSCACSARSTRCGATRRRRTRGSRATISRSPRARSISSPPSKASSVSSTTWTTREVASSAAALRHALWRAVEAQHVVSTMALVDSIDEQHVLERLLDDAKPAVPPGAAHLHWLLFTPFRYPPPPGGSRFRGPNDPGVFYGADAIRTACAELGYWRWRHLRGFAGADGDADQAANGVPGRRSRPARSTFARRRSRAIASTGPIAGDYSRCQRFGRTAREAGVGAIRYESVRDPKHAAMLRGALARRVRPSGAARAADVDAVGRARSRHLAAHARARGRGATNSSPRHGRPPRTRPHGVRAHVARDAGVHGGARRRHAGRDLAHRASAGLHARPRRPARAPAARQRHSDDQGRSRRTDHVSRAGAARRVSALRPAPAQAGGARDGPGHRSRGDRMACDSLDVSAYGKPAAPGVYTMAAGVEAKIAALGLRVSKGCTYHGLAVNIAMDLSPFADIDPCGYRGLAVTQLADLGVATTVEAAGAALAPILVGASRPSRLTMDKPVPSDFQRRRRQAQGRREDGAHPDQDRARRAAEEADWIRVRAASSPRFAEIKQILRAHNLHTVCEEASCPNIGECFSKGTATFMIMGDLCTRRCPFCDVGHGRPLPLDADEPVNLGADDRRAQAALRRDHECRPRRPSRRRRAAFRRLHPRRARALAGHADRSAGPRFSRPARARARHPRRGAARRHEPQSRNGAAPLQAGAAGLGLREFADAAARIQAALARCCRPSPD